MLRAFALSPLRTGALRSARKYPLCSGEGCQATTRLNRSGLSQRNAASSKGHFLWVTFLLGQQKKSDSAAGRPSKRPLRKRHAGGRSSIRRYRESLTSRRWLPAYAGMTSKSRKRKAENEKQKAKSEKQRAKSKEQRAESKERKAKSGKQKAESRKQKAESGKRKAESGKRKAESGKRKAESGKHRVSLGDPPLLTPPTPPPAPYPHPH